MKKKLRLILILCSLIIVNISQAQTEHEIDKKLNKLYQKGKIIKCEKKAIKFKSKNPRAHAPIYYISKVEIYAYKQFINPPNKKQLSHLKKAAQYGKKANESYPEWDNSVKQIFQDYIYSWNDTAYQSSHVKKAIQSYSKIYKDTLPAYYLYKGKKNISIAVPEIIEIPHIDSIRLKMIAVANSLVGLPYKYAGASPKTGFDCSGFTQYIYKQVGIEIPHNSHMQSQLKGESLTINEALPGDLIIFGSGNSKHWKTQHTAIVYENNDGAIKVIHSVSRGVIIDGNNHSWESYWKDRVLFIKRIPELE